MYRTTEINFDFALLMFKSAIKFYDYIWPACLYASNKDIVDETVVLSGWKNNGKIVNDLVNNELVQVGNYECQTFFEADEVSKNVLQTVTNGVFCGNYTRCQGRRMAIIKHLRYTKLTCIKVS